jgi:hypothetical protein
MNHVKRIKNDGDHHHHHDVNTHTHTHTHIPRKREKDRERDIFEILEFYFVFTSLITLDESIGRTEEKCLNILLCTISLFQAGCTKSIK